MISHFKATALHFPELALRSAARERILILTFLLIFIGLAGFDLAEDFWEGELLLHLVLEGGFFFIVFGVIALLWHGVKQFQQTATSLQQELASVGIDRNFWKDEASNYLQGLGSAIDQQFTRWNLSQAEKDIALLLLKGFSHKEIAELRKTADRTIRQQSAAIYRKANLEGRAQLSAFFLEDLLLPEKQSPAAA